MTGEGPGPLPFDAHVELLRAFITHRAAIVRQIEGLLNAQRKPDAYRQDRALLARAIDDCCFADLSAAQARRRGQLEAAHWAGGFRPRRIPGLHNDLIDPAEMMVRGFHLWQQTRWPGRNGRLHYAHTLFRLYLLRSLEMLSLRLWDDPAHNTAGGNADVAGARLAELQQILDALWRDDQTQQPILVRDARWLIPLAQSPTTDDLGAYFRVARQVADYLPERDSLEVRKASVQLIAGHLRSQIRHYCLRDGLSPDAASVVRRTRTSNALDFALLIQGLVPLLERYEQATPSGNDHTRLALAGAIFQAISPDPELFVQRVDLLGPYSMIETLFVETDAAGQAVYTPMGQRHLRLLREYTSLIDRLVAQLQDDVGQFAPRAGTYSPYGVIYGTPTNLTEDMAFKALQADAVTQFSIEDVFDDLGGTPERLAWVNGWRKLPHIDREVQKLYEYPQEFADQIFARVASVLSQGRAGTAAPADAGPAPARLLIADDDTTLFDSRTPAPEELPIRYCVASDPQIVAASRALPCEQARLSHERGEGHFLASCETAGGWFAISKDLLTEVLGAGRTVRVSGLPDAAAGVLRRMCLDLAGS